MRRLLASAAGAALFLGCISSASDTVPALLPQDLYFLVKDTAFRARGVTEYKEKKSYGYVFFDSAENAAEAYYEGKGALVKAFKITEEGVSDSQIRDKPDPWPYTNAVGVFAPPEYDLLGGYVLFMKTKPPVLVYRQDVVFKRVKDTTD